MSVQKFYSTRRFDAIAVLVLSLVAIGVLYPLWTPGIPNKGDFLMSVHRLFELDDAWRQGIFYPRFGLNLNFGYGAALFQFYPPLASYAGLLFHTLGLGFIDATKAVSAVSLFAGSVGVYVYAGALFRDRLSALISALIYLLSPYLLTVIYERGAIAESMAWGIAPWVFWATHTYSLNGRKSRGLTLAVLVALAMLAHNATAIFILPIAALYALSLLRMEHRLRELYRVAGAFLLGAGLSAFYWLPAISELGLTRTQDFMFNGATDAANNVVPLTALVQTNIFHQFAGPERFHFALWQSIVGVVAVIVQTINRKERPRALWILIAIWALIMLLQTDLMRTFWQVTPVVDSIQFPWRLYGLASFCVAVLGGAIFLPPPAPRTDRFWPRAALGLTVVVVAAWLTTTNMAPSQSPLWRDTQEAEITLTEMWERGKEGYALFGDYTLKTLKIDGLGFNLSRPEAEQSVLPPVVAPAHLAVLEYNPLRYVLGVDAAQPWTLRLHRPYFPGWQLVAGAETIPTRAAGVGGLVSADLPAGAYTVTVWFGASPVRQAANLLSVIAAAIWLVWLLPVRGRWTLPGLIVVLSVVLWGLLSLGAEARRVDHISVANPADFDGGLKLLAYELPETTFCAGEDIPLQLHWFAANTPPLDYKIFVHVATLDDTSRVAQVDTIPFDGYNPMTRWEAGELVSYVQPIPLDAATAPGRYQILVGIYDPETVQNLAVTNASNVLSGDRVRLGEVEIKNCSE